jgi:dienelactone hydrolase
MQLVMGPLSDAATKLPLDVRVTREEQLEGGLLRHTISYQSEGNDRVAAYLFLPKLAVGVKVPAVLCLHPTADIGKGVVAGFGTKTNRNYALELAQRGYVTLAPDYPSFGDHPYDFARSEFKSGTMKAIWDNQRAVDLLQSLPQVQGDRIAAIGHSLGGHNALFTAAFEPRITAVVTSCGFTRFHKYYNGNLKGWTSPRYMPRIATVYNNDPDKVPFDFPEILAAIAPRPIFVCAPMNDANFEVSGVKDSVASARPIYTLYEKPDHLQADYPEAAHDFPEQSRMRAYLFLDKHLEFTPAQRD